jgi:ABC-type amino acid transport substrate-binding protein
MPKVLGCTLVAVLAVSAIWTEPVQARSLQDIMASKEIRLGTVPYPPMTQIDPKTGEMTGLWVEGPKFMFEQLGWKVKFVEVKWATFASALQSDQIDVFVGGSFATPQRSLALDFSRPIMYMGHSVAVRKEDADKYKSLADIDKPSVTVATVLGSSGHEYARDHLKNANIKALDTGDLAAGALDVLAGRSDAAIQDSFKIAQIVNLHPDKLVNLFPNEPFHVVFVSYAVAKGNAQLLQLINTSLDWMDSTGSWQELAKPYGNQLAGVYYIEHSYKSFGAPTGK